MLRLQYFIGLACALVVWSALRNLPRDPSLHQKQYAYFANHRVLRFHKAAGYGGASGLFINEADAVLQDREGVFWVGSLLGLYTYNERRDQWVDFRQEHDERFFKYIKVLCEDKAGRIWLSSLRGIRFFERGSWHVADDLAAPVKLSNTRVLFKGNDGKLWFVTDAGLIAFDGHRWTASKKLSKAVESLHSELSAKNADQSANANSLLQQILCGLQDRAGNIWLGTKRAVLKLDATGNIWQLFHVPGVVEVLLVYEDRQGRLWFADEQGHLSIYSTKSDSWESHDLKTYFPQIEPEAITCIYQDRGGQILIGIADVGLIVFREKQKKWKILNDVTSDWRIYGVNAIFEDMRGNIWIPVREGILVLEP